MYPETEDKMSCSESAARVWASHLEDREKARSGVALPVARRAVARRLGVAPGTLENLRRGRVKGVRVWLLEKIQAAMIREIEHEMRRLEYELQMVRQGVGGAGQIEMDKAEGHITALRQILAEGKVT